MRIGRLVICYCDYGMALWIGWIANLEAKGSEDCFGAGRMIPLPFFLWKSQTAKHGSFIKFDKQLFKNNDT